MENKITIKRVMILTIICEVLLIFLTLYYAAFEFYKDYLLKNFGCWTGAVVTKIEHTREGDIATFVFASGESVYTERTQLTLEDYVSVGNCYPVLFYERSGRSKNKLVKTKVFFDH